MRGGEEEGGTIEQVARGPSTYKKVGLCVVVLVVVVVWNPEGSG